MLENWLRRENDELWQEDIEMQIDIFLTPMKRKRKVSGYHTQI